MIQYIYTRHLNETELNRAHTNEGYFRIGSNLWPLFETLMPEHEGSVSFKDLNDGPSLSTRLTKGDEYRLPGLGAFFQLIGLNTEDEIKLIFNEYDDRTDYYYKVVKHDDSLCLKWWKKHNGFELLSPGKESILIKATLNNQIVILEEKTRIKKRKDSPVMTPIYNLRIGKELFDGSVLKNVFLSVIGNQIRISTFESWKLSSVEV